MSEKLIGSCIFGQSGGPTAVINASAYGVIKTALEAEEITKVYGASYGIKGVLADRLYVMDEEDPEELRLFHPAVPMSDEDVSWTAGEIRRLYETTDKAIVLNFAGQLVEQGQRDFGFESFYYNLAAEQELMHAYFRMIQRIPAMVLLLREVVILHVHLIIPQFPG